MYIPGFDVAKCLITFGGAEMKFGGALPPPPPCLCLDPGLDSEVEQDQNELNTSISNVFIGTKKNVTTGPKNRKR